MADLEEPDNGLDAVINEMADDGQIAGFRQLVEQKKLGIRARQQAEKEVREEDYNPDNEPEFNLFEKLLELPDLPAFRVEELIPSEGRTLISAQRKVGKTTWNLNLIRSLLTGEQFLGKYAVRPVSSDGRIAFMNYEMPERKLRSWANDVGLNSQELKSRWGVITPQGRENPFNTETGRGRLADKLIAGNAQILIVDVFGSAYPEHDQNSAGMVRQWLDNNLTWMLYNSSIQDVILTAHAGKDETKGTRGSLALEEWPDSIIYLTEVNRIRYMKAKGRDVDIPRKLQLDYDRETRAVTVNKSPLEAASLVVSDRVTSLADQIVKIVVNAGKEMNLTELTDQFRANQLTMDNTNRAAAIEYIQTNKLAEVRKQGVSTLIRPLGTEEGATNWRDMGG